MTKISSINDIKYNAHDLIFWNSLIQVLLTIYYY